MNEDKLNSISSKEDLRKLTNDELIELYKRNNFSLSAIDRKCSSKNFSERLFKKRGINYNKISEDYKQDLIDAYNLNPNKCKECEKTLSYENRMNDFCNHSCSASYNNRLFIKIPKKEEVERYKSGAIKYKKDSAENHNILLDSKYSSLDIPHVRQNCCFVCGQLNCMDPFCKNHNFSQLIGLTKVGLNPKTIGTTKIFDEFLRIKEYINDLYWNKNLSILEIRKIFDINSDAQTINILKHLGIPRRSLSESQRISILTGRHNIFSHLDDPNSLIKSFKHGYHVTWFGDKVYLRSSYEKDFAQTLDNDQIKYFIENFRIKYYDSTLDKDRIAIPDFYLPDTNEIIEVKSDFTLDIQEMLDKFEAYKKLGYTPKLILEHEEIDLYNIENLISSKRLKKIKAWNIKLGK